MVDEHEPGGRMLDLADVAVVAAHNDQVHAVPYALNQEGVDPDNSVVVSTSNKVQEATGPYRVLVLTAAYTGLR